MMRHSRTLALFLALSFAFSGEGFRLRRAVEQDVSAEPSWAEEDGDFSSVEEEEETDAEDEDANDEADDADDEETDKHSFVQEDQNEEDDEDVDDDEMEDMDEQEDTTDKQDTEEFFSEDSEEVEGEEMEEQDAVESSFLDGKLDDVASAGKCSAKDRKVLKKHKGNGKSSQGYHSSKCGRSSYSLFSGMDKKAFSKCLRGKVKVSSGCAGCYANMADWSSKNCKMACMSSWCSSGCLKCTKKNQKALDGCTGFTMYKVQSC